MKIFASKPPTPVTETLIILYNDILITDASLAAVTNNGRDQQALLEYVEQNIFDKKVSDFLYDEQSAYQLNIEEGIKVSVDAIYASQRDSLMAVNVFYVSDDPEYDPIKEQLNFVKLDWKTSSNEIVVFKDGFKDVSNLKKSGSGFNIPSCLVFNVLTVSIDSNDVMMTSIGFSILPLEDPGVCALQGYF